MVVGLVVVLCLAALAATAYLGRERGFVVVPGADMAGEASALHASVEDVLPAETSASWSLRGGFDPHHVVAVIGVEREDLQSTVLDALRRRRAAGACRWPVVVEFRSAREVVSRELEDGSRVTRRRAGEPLREERLD